MNTEKKRKLTDEEIQRELDEAVREGWLMVVGRDPVTGELQYQETEAFKRQNPKLAKKQ